MNERSKFRRRRFFLPGTSQARLILGAQVLLAVMVLLAGLGLYFIANRDLTQSYFAAHLALKNVQQILFPAIIIANVVMLVLSGVVLIFYTHRIAGPAYRLGMALRQIAKGDLNQKVIFRKNDYLQELASDANMMLAFLRRQVGEMQQQCAALNTAWEQAEAAGFTPQANAELAAVLQKLVREAEGFEKITATELFEPESVR